MRCPPRLVSLACAALLLGGCVVCPVVTKRDYRRAELQDSRFTHDARLSLTFDLEVLRARERLVAQTKVECIYEITQRVECPDPSWYCSIEIFAEGDEARSEPIATQHFHRNTGLGLTQVKPLEGCDDVWSQCAVRLRQAEARAIALEQCPAARESETLEFIPAFVDHETTRFEWRFGPSNRGFDPPFVVAIDAGTGEVLECKALEEEG